MTRSDFLFAKYKITKMTGVNDPAWLSTINTRSVIIRRLLTRSGFDYKSPVLYMVNPVFITTRHGFIINRHNMEGVISTQDWGYHLCYKKLVKPTM